MELILLFGTIAVLLVIGTGVGMSIGIPSLLYLVFVLDIPAASITRRLIESLNNFPILAAPLFILAGNLMNAGGVTDRVFDFAHKLLRGVPAGLAHSNIVASIVFSGMSGSALADAGGLGAVEIKAMRDHGYSDTLSVGVTGGSSIIGPIIPPSIPAVVYAVTAGVSVGRLFVAGIVPGLLMGLLLAALVIFLASKEKPLEMEPSKIKEVAVSFLHSMPGLFAIFIILGGIISGLFTPTEAAAVAVVYVLLIGRFLYRELTWRRFIACVETSALTMVKVSFLIVTAALFGNIMIRENVALKLSTILTEVVVNPILILILINVLMLILGTFMEQLAAIMIVTPIFMPVIIALGMSPVQFGVIVVLNLMIGLLTPPVGIVLYTLSEVSGLPLDKTVRAVLPFLVPLIMVLLLITFVPWFTLALPSLFWG